MIHLWYQWGGYKPEWSAFVLRRETVHEIGFFDENNWPARHEDFDYSIRMIGTPFRKPWYRHLDAAPPRRDNRCPDLYVYHGVGGSLWGGGTDHVNDESGHRPGSARPFPTSTATIKSAADRRRSAPTWGDNGGPKVGNDCHDPKMLAKVKDIRGTAHWQHPTGADYYPPGIMWVPFSRPLATPVCPCGSGSSSPTCAAASSARASSSSSSSSSSSGGGGLGGGGGSARTGTSAGYLTRSRRGHRSQGVQRHTGGGSSGGGGGRGGAEQKRVAAPLRKGRFATDLPGEQHSVLLRQT